VSLDLFDLFAVVAPGLEATCAAELAALGVPARALPGGVAFTGDATALALANLRLATATRVLVRLGEFHAAAFSELHSRAARLPWEQYFAGPPASPSRPPPTSLASTTPAASASELLKA
jgi:putative N6-adenine-specific DNA methylase